MQHFYHNKTSTQQSILLIILVSAFLSCMLLVICIYRCYLKLNRNDSRQSELHATMLPKRSAFLLEFTVLPDVFQIRPMSGANQRSQK